MKSLKLFGWFLLAGGLGMGLAGGQAVPFPADDSSALLLHLDGNAADSSGNEVPCAARGKSRWAPGKFGQALSLDGQSALVIPARPVLHVGERSWTAECWIKPAKQKVAHAYILSSGWGFERHYWIRISHNQQIAACFSGGSGGIVSTGDISAQLFDGQWHHVAAVLDQARAGEIRLYLDGRRAPSKKPAFSPPITFDNERMLAAIGTFAPWTLKKSSYVGLIDEVRFSNVVRPEYTSTEPLPESVRTAQTPSRFIFDPADSKKPLSLDPANTIIVTPARYLGDGHVRAALLLSEWLRKVYRVPRGFDRVQEQKVDSIEGKTLIALGPTRWADKETIKDLWRDGFIIRRKANVIVINAPRARGVYFGAVHFLDRFCGVRFYMPTDLFTSLPEKKTVTLGEIDVRSEPFVKSAFLSGVCGIPGDKGWLMRSTGVRRVGGTHQHSMYLVFPPERFAKKYPGIYPFIKGQRHIPESRGDQRWQPCFSEPKLLDAAMESARDFFRKHPIDAYLAFSVQDSHSVCECGRCSKVYKKFEAQGMEPRIARGRGASQLYWQFIQELGRRFPKELPGRFLIAMAYGPARFPPDYNLPECVILFTNFHVAELDADKILAPGPDGESKLEQVLRISSYYGNHDWYHGNGFLIPRIYTGYWARFMHQLRVGAKGAFMHAEAYPNWGLDGPKYYFLARLWWNPDLELPKLWNLFCSDMFGPAAKPMLDYFMALEKLWITLDNVKGPERKLFQYDRQFLADPDDMQQVRKCRVLLNQAAGLAKTPEQKQRIDLFSRTFRVSESLYELASAKTFDATRAAEIRQYTAEIIVPDPMTLYRTRKKEEPALAVERTIRIIKSMLQRRNPNPENAP